ncbi:hypothetical protein [Roseateles amylovorans]|uniref:Uncharacterized protein n=1 Tax=Roseateles amylovorans TaxID=2978473 RepID=A0ABY6B4N6_9BURK|nr:hypothetical protein [Roseateles amylovorans]UXH80007.1 hypothetical protein N4261_09045 [Roseateles amylovorans]
MELHITRAEFWAENEGSEITAEEWLAHVEADPDLSLHAENGPYYAVWSGPSKHEEPWLEWFQGNVSSKWPDTALYQKMLQVAGALGARVQDDDGTFYEKETDWQFNPE